MEDLASKELVLDFDAVKSLVAEGKSILLQHNIVVVEWDSTAEDQSKPAANKADIILKFFIPKEKPAIYEGINSISDAEAKMKLVRQEAKKLQDAMYDILEFNEKTMAPDLMKTIEVISSLVDRFYKVITEKTNRFRQSMEVNSVEELTDAVTVTIKNAVKINLIDTLIPSIYQGMKHDYDSNYELVLTNLNKFLQSLGIYTLEVKPGGKIDYDTCTASEDSRDHVTKNYEQDESIDEVRKYPYFMGGNVLVSEGEVYVWRLER